MSDRTGPERQQVVELILRYYDACNRGDAQAIAATLSADSVHYFLAQQAHSAPLCGGQALGHHWHRVQERFAARWVLDHVLVDGPEAVVEWTMFWQPQGSARIRTRGTEWMRLRDMRIQEVRAYYRQQPSDNELHDFPYASRGYSIAGQERSTLHHAEG